MNAINRRRGVFTMLLGAAATIVAAVMMMIPGLTPFSPNPAEAADKVCTVGYYALDPNDSSLPNSNKEVTGAFGPAVEARDEAGIKAELDERRECGADGKFDPALTAAQYAEWSHNGLTSIKVDESPDGLNAFTARLVSDKDLRGDVLAELKKLEGESTFSTAPVSAGIWSLYMMPNGSGGVDLKVGRTSANGTNAVFTHGDKVVRYRLDCGFQPNRDTPFTNVPECTGEECAPPPVCPPGTTGTPPNCVAPKVPSEDPYPQGNAPIGGGQNDDPGPGEYTERPADPPTTPYVPPAPPAPEPEAPKPGDPKPQPTEDPAPPPAPEPEAPKPEEPETGCVVIPGVEDCS